jgi:hypothetical protein
VLPPIRSEASLPQPSTPTALRSAAIMFAGMLVLFGGVMWALRGEAVFTDLISAALAWCF